MNKKVKVKEKDIQKLKFLCVVIALTAGALAVLYLFDLFQNWWVLDCILGLGILLQAVLAVLLFVKHKNFLTVFALILMVLFLGALIYFNMV